MVSTLSQVSLGRLSTAAQPADHAYDADLRIGADCEGLGMTQYSKGSVLTCGHEECGCRVRIEEECHCPSGEQGYTCACGAPMVEVSDPTGQSVDPAR